MGKSKSKKGGSSTAVAAKCTCDHPFKCDCGNRPERPSKGHKWYSDTQTWAGKGHKQKGGSGQVKVTGEQVKVTEKGQTQLSQWQKLPSSILSDYCQKQKRPSPKFKKLVNDTHAPKFKYRVILQDNSTKRDKDLIFIPSSTVTNEEQAKEETALLALLHLTPKLPHERRLPEPYRTTWLAAIESLKNGKKRENKNAVNTTKVMTDKGQKISNSNSNKSSKSSGSGSSGAASNTNLTLGSAFLSKSERRHNADQKRHERNARIRKYEAQRMANRDHPVLLSAKLRNQIQQILRGDFKGLLDNNDDDNIDSELSIYDSDVQAFVEERLYNEGFTKRQARAAFQNQKESKSKTTLNEEDEWDRTYENCLQFLCVHLSEDQLPEGFDPREGTLSLIVAGKDNGVDSIGNSSDAAKAVASKFGISLQDANWLLEQQQGDKKTEVSLEILFWKQICKIANVQDQLFLGKNQEIGENDDDNDEIENENVAREELEAIQAMFDNDCTLLSSPTSTTLVIKTPELLNVHFSYTKKRYPSIFPRFILFLGKWERVVGVAFHVAIAKFLSTLQLGEQMFFEIYGEEQNMIQTMDELPILSLKSVTTASTKCVPKTIVNENDTASSSSSTTSTTTSSTISSSTSNKMNSKRPKSRNVFFSTSPKQTPPATSFCWNKSMERQRKSLPAWNARSDFLSKLQESSSSSNRVVLVTGDTGCGKTTQIPQFILEEYPTTAKIVVAQPRRLAATGVAARVADERGETQPGTGTVGYVVRGNSAFSKHTRLLFCTFGILLRQLQSEGALNSVTHIVIDEVHERNLDGDVLMGLLREALKTVPHLKVILMSATLDADRFASYWGNAPQMHIPGRTFPVEDYTLEDVLEKTGYNPPKKRRRQGGGYNNHRSTRKATAWNDSEISDDDGLEDDDEVDPTKKNSDKSDTKQPSVPLEERVKRVDQTNVDYFLLAFLVKYIVETNQMGADGSILVFLQGVGEISQAQTVVANITKGMSILLLPLHGSLQPQEQSKIFRTTPGQVKVILSTNVAETSITIPDCTVVIDSCREKQSSYDPVNRMPMLLDQFASKASLKQRRGRAGRVRSGKCYKLISKNTYSKLPDHTAPEITRCALDQTLLSLLFLGAEDGTGRFLRKLLDPPSRVSVKAAISSLKRMGALEESNHPGKLRLSPLGMHLAGIPAPPTIGKLLVMGCILGCRTGALAMAAGLSVGRSPFLKVDHRSNDERSLSILDERKKLFETCGNSDHSMIAAAFIKWRNTPNGHTMKKRCCESLGLSFNGMRDINQLVQQYDSSLSGSGFPSSKDSDRNLLSWRVIRTCAVASMAPEQLVRVYRPSAKYEETAEGAKSKDGEAREHKFFIRPDTEEKVDGEKPKEERVFLHPSSAMFSVGTYRCPWLVFHSMIRTSKPFLRDATECSAYGLLLFGGMLTVEARNSVIHIDGWARLSANARVGALIQGLRSKMDDLLQQKIDNPKVSISDTLVMQVIVKLIISDGHGN